MKNAFIFHGTGGFPEENWFPWLKTELENHDIAVTVPEFPTPKGQSFDAWLEIMKPYQNAITPDTLLIGHSLGGLFLLRYLEQLEHPVAASIFVAASAGVKPIKFYEADAAFSDGFAFNWGVIRRVAGNVAVFHSDDDPYVSLGNGELIADKLDADLAVIQHAGHFNASSGYISFPQLLESVLEITTDGHS